MKITVTNVKKTLEKDYGWANLESQERKVLVDELIKDVLDIVDNKLKRHKGVSIKS